MSVRILEEGDLMRKWIDVSPDETLLKYVCADNIDGISYERMADGVHAITVYFGPHNQYIHSHIEEKIFRRFNDIAEAIGLNHRLGEQKPTAISAFRQHEEANRKKKRTVAEI